MIFGSASVSQGESFPVTVDTLVPEARFPLASRLGRCTKPSRPASHRRHGCRHTLPSCRMRRCQSDHGTARAVPMPYPRTRQESSRLGNRRRRERGSHPCWSPLLPQSGLVSSLQSSVCSCSAFVGTKTIVYRPSPRGNVLRIAVGRCRPGSLLSAIQRTTLCQQRPEGGRGNTNTTPIRRDESRLKYWY